jgi:hypothetical protein
MPQQHRHDRCLLYAVYDKKALFWGVYIRDSWRRTYTPAAHAGTHLHIIIIISDSDAIIAYVAWTVLYGKGV